LPDKKKGAIHEDGALFCQVLREADQASSIASAVASPPPMHRLATLGLAMALERADQRGDDARARSADRVAERGGAAMDVHLVMRDAQIVHREHGDTGKGLVHLEQVDVLDGPASLVQHLLDRADRSGGEILGFVGMGGQRDDLGHRGQALGVSHALAGEHEGGCAVEIDETLPP
jgi:hypothetical protein